MVQYVSMMLHGATLILCFGQTWFGGSEPGFGRVVFVGACCSHVSPHCFKAVFITHGKVLLKWIPSTKRGVNRCVVLNPPSGFQCCLTLIPLRGDRLLDYRSRLFLGPPPPHLNLIIMHHSNRDRALW